MEIWDEALSPPAGLSCGQEGVAGGLHSLVVLLRVHRLRQRRHHPRLRPAAFITATFAGLDAHSVKNSTALCTTSLAVELTLRRPATAETH